MNRESRPENSEDSEETLFLKTFGIKSPALRIIDFLMDNKAYDYSKTDIEKGPESAERLYLPSGRT